MTDSIPVFTSKQIEVLCEELCSLIRTFTLVNCYEHQKRFCFLLEKGKEQKRLFFCLEKPFIRFHLLSKDYYPLKKWNHSFLEKQLMGYQLIQLETLNHDRIVQLTFRKAHHFLFLIVEFFPKHPNYYLINEKKEILVSLYPSSHTHYQLPNSNPASHPITEQTPFSQEVIAQFYYQLEHETELQQKKAIIQSKLNQKLKSLQKKHDKLVQELKICLDWEKLRHEGELLKAHFSSLKRGLSTIQVWDWLQDQMINLSINSQLTPQEIIAQKFKQSKKRQAGIPHLQKQQQLIEQQIESTTQLLEKLETSQEQELDQLSASICLENLSSSKKKPLQVTLPYHEYESSTGTKIWVGKNARQNEILTFNLAKGSDWWLHVQSFAGSHVIIRTYKGKEPDQETLLDACQLALQYSKAKNQGEAEICLTQRKFVSRFGKKQTGQVQISKHKLIFIRFDNTRYQHLKERRSITKNV